MLNIFEELLRRPRLSAAGRSSTDPATARKIEAKKLERRMNGQNAIEPGRAAADGQTVGYGGTFDDHGLGL